MGCRRCRTKKRNPDGTYSWHYGRVLVDRLYPQDKRIELYCIQCGKRWFVKNNRENAFSKWLIGVEYQHRLSYGISS